MANTLRRGSVALVALGSVFVSTTAMAVPVPAGLRVVARSGADSPMPGLKYDTLGAWAAGKDGEVVLRAQVASADKATSEQVIVREGPQRSVVVSSATPRPGGGSWDNLADGELRVRGSYYSFSTPSADLSEITWWALDGATGAVRRLYGSNDTYGGKPIGKGMPIVNAQGLMLAQATAGVFTINGANVQKPVFQYLSGITGLPSEWTAPATGIPLPLFLDDNGVLTVQVQAERPFNGGPSTEAKLFTMHGGVDATLSELVWANPFVVTGPNSSYSQAILDVGRGGAMVGQKTTTETAPKDVVNQAYFSGDGVNMTQAFEIAGKLGAPTPLPLGGVSITRVTETRAIDSGSFVFVGIDESNKAHLFRWSGGAAQRLAGTGVDAPGTGATFDDFTKYAFSYEVNRRGQVLFYASAGGKEALFLAEPGQPPTLVVQEDNDLTLDDGRTVAVKLNGNGKREVSLGDDGTVAFPVGFAGANGAAEQAILSRGDASAPTADLELKHLVSNDGVLSLVIKNLGPAKANGVRLTVKGAAVRFVNRHGEQCTVAPTEVTCSVPTAIEVGQDWFAYDFETDLGGTLEATVYGPSDPNLSNNSYTWLYEPKSQQDIDEEGCSAAPTRRSTETSSFAAAGLALAVIGALRRRDRRTRRP